jgi:hypothetical protein
MTKGRWPGALRPSAIVVAAMTIVLSGCGERVPSGAPVPSSSAAAFGLRHWAPPAFCPFVGAVDLTFRIEPYAGEPVTAVGQDGRTFNVMWPPGFRAGTADNPVVTDGDGRVVAGDGERLRVPPLGFPNLHGHSVCFGSSIYVMEGVVP